MIDKDAKFGCKQGNPVACRTCVFARSIYPVGDQALKDDCLMYFSKPKEVYFDGKECPEYVSIYDDEPLEDDD